MNATSAKKISSDDRIALLGSSRGLGWHTYLELQKHNPKAQYFLSSRKILNRSAEVSDKTVLSSQDFSTGQLDTNYLNELIGFAPTRLIYLAGGGPYGLFEEKKWSDHQWALNTSFLYPAQLIHSIAANQKLWPQLKQIVVIGSAIAEQEADPLAASYASAKHAMKGLISSVQKEGSAKPEILLFSPGYMQTDLLPLNSKPRQNGTAESAHDVAKKLIAFIEKSD